MVIDSNDETLMWSMVNRFAVMHEKCGFAAPMQAEKEEPVKTKVVQPGKFRLDD